MNENTNDKTGRRLTEISFHGVMPISAIMDLLAESTRVCPKSGEVNLIFTIKAQGKEANNDKKE